MTVGPGAKDAGVANACARFNEMAPGRVLDGGPDHLNLLRGHGHRRLTRVVIAHHVVPIGLERDASDLKLAGPPHRSVLTFSL